MAKIGDRVIAVVDPRGNDGADEAPATVTRVHKDGTVDLSVHLNGGGSLGLGGVELHNSRKAADAALGKHLEDLKPQQDGHGERRDPELRDVLRWVSVAYDPAARRAPAPESPGSEIKTAE